MSDHLFDPSRFGGVRPKRSRSARQAEPMVRVCPPWVLLRSTQRRPVAHLWTDTTRRNGWGAAIADCGAVGATLHVDGTPLAIACRECSEVA